jgi:hypothetical protein
MSQRAEWSPEGHAAKLRNDVISSEKLRTNFCERFADLMRAAMLVSAYKYGEVAEAYPDRVNALESLGLRLAKYAETGNVEYLVDVANFAMIEFMHPAHPGAFFKSTDADGSPGRVARNEIYDRPNQFANRDLADVSEQLLR